MLQSNTLILIMFLISNISFVAVIIYLLIADGKAHEGKLRFMWEQYDKMLKHMIDDKNNHKCPHPCQK